MTPYPRIFVSLVGPRNPRHSFMKAFSAGVVFTWVDNAEDLPQDSAAGVCDLIVFEVRHRSEAQCRKCRHLLGQGQKIVCLGCDPTECPQCVTAARDPLDAALAAFGWERSRDSNAHVERSAVGLDDSVPL